ncbi:MAG TPA: LuxR C-terminal-related transcriptional regulator [Nitrospiria bacterium]|jgi:DNA-binding NarL/FixJ family response regulator
MITKKLKEKRKVGRPRKEGSENLTEREIEVLKLLANGNTVKTVASQLNISTKTVDTHTVRLMRKIKVRNRVGLVKYALREKLILLED